MNDSSILIRDIDPTLLASGHIDGWFGLTRVSKHYAYNRCHGPSSTLHSNIVDMSRWAIANMNGGELEGTRILDAASYELLWTPAREGVRIADGNRLVHIGLSWFLTEIQGHQIVCHGGQDTGYRTNFIMYPEAGLAVIVLSNYSGPDETVGQIPGLVRELLLGSE
jgi:CubicO group peptidase (beta-lactamase class C family)